MRAWLCALAFLVAAAPAGAASNGTPDAAEARRTMVRIVETKTARTAPLTSVSHIDPAVTKAMKAVPRHRFVPERVRPYAYAPTPLPLSHGQRIASPFLVALMTHLADVREGDRVFETGTGAGYQAAVLAEMGATVVSVEVVREVGERARRRLNREDVDGVTVHIADGYYGWPPDAPYDAIIVKEAVGNVPPALLEQLAVGGKLVLPLGPSKGGQKLTVITKTAPGSTDRRRVMPVRFAPLQGGERI